jgi:putative FmdB family regulatory protein
LIVQSVRSFTASQSNAMASKKVLNSQLMSGSPNVWDAVHLVSKSLMMKELRNYPMAYYEFKCSVCNTTYGINRDINADGDVAAPNCSKCGLTMERIYSITGITFKGTGWGKDA